MVATVARRQASRRKVGLVALVQLTTSMHCTLTSDFGVHECESHADCDTLDGTVRRCEHSECVIGCADNRQCAAIDPRYPICPSFAAQCAAIASDGGACFASSGYSDAEMGTLQGNAMLVLGAS